MSGPADPLLSAWVGLTRLAAPLGRAVVAVRRRRGKEDPLRWPERLGRGAAPGEGPPVVWVHAASVGETVAALPLVGRIVAAGRRVVLTTVTTTSAEIAAARLPAGAVHRFVPLDMAPFMDRFLGVWRPGLAVFLESEIWPVAIARLDRAGIPLVVSNGRMSDRSFRGWARVPAVARTVFGRVSLCLAQGEADAARFRDLGVRTVVDVGNIKFDAPVPEADPQAADALVRAVAGRRVFLAASTHPGEEAAVLDALAILRRARSDLLAILAPRHPARGPEVADLARARGLVAVRREGGALPDAGTDVYVADTVGELGTLYRLADAAFVGGSLVGSGGHNPIEPARCGAPIVTGPDVSSFRDAYGALAGVGGVGFVDGAETLAAEVRVLLEDPAARARRTAAAGMVVARHAGALDRSFAALAPLLPEAGATR